MTFRPLQSPTSFSVSLFTFLHKLFRFQKKESNCVSDVGSLSSNFGHGMEGNVRSVLYKYAPHNDVSVND